MEQIIDAKGKSLGRVASQAAMILMGKSAPTYRREIYSGAPVKIINASKIKISDKKMEQTDLHPLFRLSGRHQDSFNEAGFHQQRLRRAFQKRGKRNAPDEQIAQRKDEAFNNHGIK